MSAVQLYCHSCNDVVLAGAEEFTCSRCNGGFVELYETQRRTSSEALGASNSSLDEDEDPLLLQLNPFLMMMQGSSAIRSNRNLRLPNPQPRSQTSSQEPMEEAASTPEDSNADPRASNSQPDSIGSSRQSTQPTRAYDPMRLTFANSRRMRGLTSRSSTTQVSASASAQQPTHPTGVNTDQSAPINRFSSRPTVPRRGGLPLHFQPRSQLTSRSPTSNDHMENLLTALFTGVAQPDAHAGATAAGVTQVPPHYMSLAQLFPFAQLFPPLHGNPGDYVFSEQGIDNVITQLLGQLGSTGGPPPATAEVLERLPDAHITAEQTQSGLQCFVCFEEFSKDEKVKRLPCGHHYHTDCIMPWLEQHGTCPVCRKTLEGVDTSTYSHDHFVREAEAAPNSSTATTGAENRNENESDGERDNEQYFDAPDDADSTRDPRHPGYFS